MIENIFLFDTYALMEILNKNPNYKNYLESRIIINDFIFAEFCYALFRNNLQNTGDFLASLANKIIHAKPMIIKEAMAFRVKNKKQNLSMPDCIGYIMAKELGIKFLTGDKEFEKLEGVEFVK